MAIFKGAGVALVTPYNEDESINYEALGELVEEQIKGHTDAIIVCGTTGEPATMTEEERTSCMEFVVKKVAGRIPVIAGTGCNCTRNAIALSKKAEEIGVDGLLVVTPYYNKATQEGLYEHYKAIAASTKLPIIMYNVPSRTGCNIMPQTAARLGKECENIVGIKEASGNISQVAELASLTKGYLDIYSGNDDEVIPILSLGGIGVISVLSNVAPQQTHDMVMEYLEGDREKALQLQLSFLPLIHALFCEVNPIPVKAALNMLGKNAGVVRLPLTNLSKKNRPQLENALKECKLL
ncbi:MAG: 4-hydroxy-tetrahydrodipicolinate synthase [Roseburia sp.]|uniref:4-hydroxy-tetrahydrodipicolinate synthase n=1 Tax=Roseburia sp. 831b TaxID=1261635 RepID=UPI0009518666|nr:4-hydroxy-tetrahydrodipicolinate synthase [Roseburia sp. 831b]MDD6216891.1 4-hydroxy-tetrahydrodipicolinate synthase [Roseburia sp.]WVK71807.1 4-hydroxy-tetrahydrodipicolinate synthase [Roseburia sp. 831b]